MQSSQGCNDSHGFYLSSEDSNKISTWSKVSEVGMWATNALIFHPIHTPVTSQGFPLTKHNFEPDTRGFRRIRPMGISSEGHQMEQRRWIVDLEM